MSAPTKNHYATDTEGGYSGKVKNNWNGVYQQALARAKENIYNDLAGKANAADVIVDQYQKHDRPSAGHSMSYKWTGGHEENVTGQHDHTDWGPFHQFKNWQGWRSYHWDFEVEEKPME